MAINFASIPANTLVPGFYVEFDLSQAGSAPAQPHTVLLVGQQTSAAVVATNSINQVSSKDDGYALHGAGSQLGQMVRAYKEMDPTVEVFTCAQDDSGTAVSAGGSIDFTGTATEAGVIPMYIGGRRVTFAVAVGDDAAACEVSALAALALQSNLPVTYAASAGTGVDFTAVQGGTIGNRILLGVCLGAGERVPAGLTAVATPMSGGANDPDYAGVVTAMGEDQYHTIVLGLETKAEVDKVKAELESRFQPPREIEGLAYIGKPDSQADLTTYGNAAHSDYGVLVVVGYEESAYSPLPWEVAARRAAVSAKQTRNDPSVAVSGKSLGATAYAAPRGSRFTWTERNTLLSDGISTVKASQAGNMVVDYGITTYQTNSLGQPDDALKDEQHFRLLSAIRYSFKVWFARYFNAKLADDGNDVKGQLYMTPAIGRAEALAWFVQMQTVLGWVENYDQFESELIVERDATNPNRMNFLLPVDLVNALLVGAAKVAHRR